MEYELLYTPNTTQQANHEIIKLLLCIIRCVLTISKRVITENGKENNKKAGK